MKNKRPKIPFGTTVRDSVTGFVGVVTGRIKYMTGFGQVLVLPKAAADGAHRDGIWIDVDRVEIDEAVPVVALPRRTTDGPDQPPRPASARRTY